MKEVCFLETATDSEVRGDAESVKKETLELDKCCRLSQSSCPAETDRPWWGIVVDSELSRAPGFPSLPLETVQVSLILPGSVDSHTVVC